MNVDMGYYHSVWTYVIVVIIHLVLTTIITSSEREAITLRTRLRRGVIPAFVKAASDLPVTILMRRRRLSAKQLGRCGRHGG